MSAPAISDEEPVWPEVRALLRHAAFGGALDYAADTMDALRSEPVDAMLIDDLTAGPAIGAEIASIPCSARTACECPTAVRGVVPDDSPEYQAAEQASRAINQPAEQLPVDAQPSARGVRPRIAQSYLRPLRPRGSRAD